MHTKTIAVSEAQPGMLVANDIYTFNNKLLISSNTPLSDRIITRLKFYAISEIEIIDDGGAKTEEELGIPKGEEGKTYSSVIRLTPEYHQFSEAMQEFTSDFKTSLNDIFINGKDVDTNKLLMQVDDVLSESRNSLHLLNMLNCMKDHSDHTYVHCINVSLICNVFGKWLNFSEQDISILTLCGLLHDIGKIAIPKEILDSPTKLSDSDYDIIKTHTTKGYQLLKNKNVDDHIKHTALMHHERCDGSGYPNRYLGRNIDKFAKIVSIADVYDAMTSPRVYRGPLCPFEVIEFFEFEGFQKFEPQYILTFLTGIVESYLHSTVKLSNGQIGTIIMINKNYLSRPIIQVEGGEFIDLSHRKNVDIVSVL